MGVGFMCYSASFSIVQMSYRGLVRDQQTFKPDDWTGSGFADQQALTRHLAQRVIPRLDDPRFSVRHAAQEVLTSLWPLSKPAVDAAAGKLATDEGQMRIKAMQEFTPEIQIVKGPGGDAHQGPDSQGPPGGRRGQARQGGQAQAARVAARCGGGEDQRRGCSRGPQSGPDRR